MRPPKLGNIRNAAGFSEVSAFGLASLLPPRQQSPSCEKLRFNNLFLDVPDKIQVEQEHLGFDHVGVQMCQNAAITSEVSLRERKSDPRPRS